MITQSPPSNWRLKPGYLSYSGSQFESVHILLGRFLADRHSSNPLSTGSLLSDNPSCEWGKGQPFEKVIDSPEAFAALIANPQLFRHAIAIIEPWKHVGCNPLGEEVRASVNVAYLAQKVADCDSILFPYWASGPLDLERLIPVISSGLAIVVEGGDPSVRNPSTFAGASCSHQDLLRLSEQILLSRTPASAPAIFICLGHQLAAQAHISLIRRAVREVLALDVLEGDGNGKALRALQRVCQEIQAVGQSLVVKKRDGRVVADNWEHQEFAVAHNEAKEIGDRQLRQYESPDHETSGVPEPVIVAHEITADEHEGVIDTSIAYEHELNIAMFHSDEVNEELYPGQEFSLHS